MPTDPVRNKPEQHQLSEQANTAFEKLKTAQTPEEELDWLRNDAHNLSPEDTLDIFRESGWNGSLETLKKLENHLQTLQTSLNSGDTEQTLAPYILVESFSLLHSAGESSPLLPKIAKAVGKMREKKYKDPSKLTAVLLKTVSEHIKICEKENADNKIPPNPFSANALKNRKPPQQP